MKYRYLPWLLALGLTTACDDKVEWEGGDGSGGGPVVSVAGVGPNGAAGLFPHDRYTVEDPTTYTGRRVQFTEADDPTIALQKPVSRSVIAQLNQLNGFGTSAGAWIRFSTPIDVTTPVADTNVFMGYMRGDEVVIVPSEASTTADQVMLRPYFPMPPNHENFFFATKGILSADGKAVAADPELATILGATPPTDALQLRTRRIAQALATQGAIGSTGDLLALGVYTSQSIHEQSIELVEQIESIGIQGVSEGECEVRTRYRVCYFTYEMPDYTGPDMLLDDDAIDTEDVYTIRAIVYLPLESVDDYEIPYDPARGYPISIFGHGLTGRMADADMVARYSAAMGVASVAIDAPRHGEHPYADPGTEDMTLILGLFGLQSTPTVDVNVRALRDGWRHSNLDKIALVEALKNGVDLDGDPATVELDPTRITYLGGSLGAIQGSEFLALSKDISGGLFAVGGARLSDIVRYGQLFKLFRLLLLPQAQEDELNRFYVLLQTGVEVGDGVNWAPYVMQNRLRGTLIPDIAMQASIPDEIVPAETALVLARALGTTLIGDVPMPSPLIPAVDGPISGNHPSGRTAGFIQIDWQWKASSGQYEGVSHSSGPESQEAIAYWLQAYRTLLNDGIMTLSNPYPIPGAPPKP